MQLIPLDQIQVPSNRQRREFKPEGLVELQTSIEQVGLQLPLVVRQLDGITTLVSGERRLRVLKDMTELGMDYRFEQAVITGLAPCAELGELEPLEAMQAEYDENCVRTDLTWVEKAEATALLAKLRGLQAKAEGRPEPTSKEIGIERYLDPLAVATESDEIVAQRTARMELIVSRYLDDPEVRSQTGLGPAFKLIQRRETATRHAQIAEKMGPTYGRHSHTLLHANALTWLPTVEPNQFTCICTDPPYFIGSDEYGDSGGMSNLPHGYEDKPEEGERFYSALAPLLYHVAKPDAHLYMFCDIDWFYWLKHVFSEARWKTFRTPLMWHKPAGMRAPWPQQGPQRKYELILYAVKGSRPCNRLAGDVLTYPPDDNLGHAAQKPVALFADLLARSCVPGDRVLDVCAGTGTILAAAHQHKLLATAVEVDQVSYGIALKRLTELK
jgi:site-specific DNA-methyltransferase (adenine-specific)